MSGRNRRFGVAGSLTALVVALAVALVTGATHAQLVTRGSVVEFGPGSIFDDDLRRVLDEFVPTTSAHSTLIVFTECYGGDKLDDFLGRAGTTVLSATSPGQTAVYGGYDNDAAAALDAGAGRTSTTVHTAGVAGKHASETPLSQGPVFSLEPTNPGAGPIKSRHVLYFAGQPNAADNAYRDTIRANFAGDAATTVTTAGGSGKPGYDYPGTFKGMCDALDIINNTMNADEQFILFISDHGNLDKSHKSVACAAGTCTSGSLVLGATLYNQMLVEPFNLPRVSLLHAGPTDPGDVNISVSGGQSFNAVKFSGSLDLNHDGDLVDVGEGRVAVAYLNEGQINPSGVTVTVTGQPSLTSMAVINLESGAIAKIGWIAIPALSTWGLVVLLAVLLGAAAYFVRRVTA